LIPLKANVATRRLPLATGGLIVAAALWWLLAQGGIVGRPAALERDSLERGVIPARLAHPSRALPRAPVTTAPWLTPFTAALLSASIVQLAFNALALWNLGPCVEETLGAVRTLALVLLSALASAALLALVVPGVRAPLIGAAGACSGVFGAAFALRPGLKVVSLSLVPGFATTFEMPGAVWLALWAGVQCAFAALDLTDPLGGGGAAAWLAWPGGLLVGLALGRPLSRTVRGAGRDS